MAYPRLDQAVQLKFCSLIKAFNDNPNDLADNGYLEPLKKALIDLSIKNEPAKAIENVNLISEIKTLYSDLTLYGKRIPADDINAKMTWFKTRAQLTVKLMDLQEQGNAIEKYTKLKDIVTAFVMENFTNDQVEEFTRSLELADIT